MQKTLDQYLAIRYSIHLIADQEAGGYLVIYPDLPGCMTQIESLDEFVEAAEEIRQLWIETEYARGHDIPEPAASLAVA